MFHLHTCTNYANRSRKIVYQYKKAAMVNMLIRKVRLAFAVILAELFGFPEFEDALCLC